MTKKQRAAEAVRLLKEAYPDAICSLDYAKPHELLISVRLAAQCTDARVNMVTPALFEKYPTLEALASATPEEIGEMIKSCGLYKTKAASIKASAIKLRDEFSSVIPDDMDTLLTFPGVGRKIANLLLGDIYHKPAIVADTHCMRICGRLGMYREGLRDPKKVELILSDIVAPEKQSDFCHRIVQFGRDTCSARAPKCEGCPLRELCEHNLRTLK